MDILKLVSKGAAGSALLLGAIAVGHLGIIILGGVAAFAVVVGAAVLLSAIFGNDKVYGRIMGLLGLILDRPRRNIEYDTALDVADDADRPVQATSVTARAGLRQRLSGFFSART